MHRRLSSLAVAVLLPAVQSALLPAASLSSALLLSPAPARAQSAEAVARTARAITVRLEGVGSPGSGVLVKREGNRYTVLTAWHVVSGQNPGEELYVVTPDGRRHPLEQGSIKRIGEVDMAILIFSSSQNYDLAQIGDVKSVKRGDQVFVAGFPADRDRRLKYDPGTLVANADVGIDQGYQLLYTNDTQSGMSGGVVLNRQGELVGMHGRGELDEIKSARTGMIIKTGTNQGVPISYYRQWVVGVAVVASASQTTSADDYLAQARALVNKKGREHESIYLSNQVLAVNPQDAVAYYIRGIAKGNLGDTKGAIIDYTQVITINPRIANAYNNRAIARVVLSGDRQAAIEDLNQALIIDPQYANAYYNRGAFKSDLGDRRGAIADLNQALAINPQLIEAYMIRAAIKGLSGDRQGAIADLSQALAINPQLDEAYFLRGSVKIQLGDKQGAMSDLNNAISVNPKFCKAYNNRGVIYAQIGDMGRACSDWRTAASLGEANEANLKHC